MQNRNYYHKNEFHREVALAVLIVILLELS